MRWGETTRFPPHSSGSCAQLVRRAGEHARRHSQRRSMGAHPAATQDPWPPSVNAAASPSPPPAPFPAGGPPRVVSGSHVPVLASPSGRPCDAALRGCRDPLLLLSRQQSASLRCRLSFLDQPSRRPDGSRVAAPGASVRCMADVDTAPAATAASSTKSNYEIVTLTTWLLKQEQAGVIDNEMTILLSSISTACKQIAALVQRAPISNLTGVQGAVNVQGEDQKKLDVVSNEVFSNCLRSSGRTGVIASEEEDVPVAVEESYSGNYIVVFDPLDGSSNIDAAVSTGSIFGIYAPNDECLVNLDDDAGTLGSVEQRCVVSVCQPGSNLLAAGYCMYSSSVIFVLTVGAGVYVFTLDPMYGEFVLTQEKLQIPKAGKIYAFNEGNYALWDDKLKKYMDSLKEPGDSGKPYSARYIGSLVGDFHRTLLYGGIYGYPRDKKSKNGKLRLLYECAPMSFIVEQAGGKGSDGHQRILDIIPTEVHQRVPLYIGSVEEVDKVEKYLA